MMLNKWKSHVLYLGRNTPCTTTGWGQPSGKQSGKALGMLVDKNLAMNQQCTLAAKKAIGFLGCVRKSIASRLTEMILPLCSDLVRHIWRECCVHCWAPQDKQDMDTLEFT
ncbi:hypothetical protein QYF61_026268 [Mycteria americana]|uniref:Uncharacterized protein n=1 Tax=Mycteria americana TaxID=33587 RepID=A0AAN7P8X0_MYCAM|nr:hypothetical protein QYF61_026268 [Mycteria americana]